MTWIWQDHIVTQIQRYQFLSKNQKYFQLILTINKEEVLIYFGDDRGNIRVIDVSWVLIYPDSRKPIQKTDYFPEQKASFIPKRKGNYKIDKIGESLIKIAKGQKLPKIQNYSAFWVCNKRCHGDIGSGQPVDLLKYLIEPEIIISSGGDKKVKFYNLKLEIWGWIDMLTGNRKGMWNMPFSWKKRREKELNEVRTIYNEIQRREDLINQYYLKVSIMKGDRSVLELENYLNDKKK